MDFLALALFDSSSNFGDSKCSGALITHFDTEDYTSRAEVRYMSIDTLVHLQSTELNPMGFKVEEDGTILSDTQCRQAVDSDIAEYVGQEFKGSVTSKLGLIDLLLFGAQNGFYVLANPATLADGAPPILIPFNTFKVSESSFNIYAAYKNSDNKYRTFSMMDIEKDEEYPLTIAVPETIVNKLGKLEALLTHNTYLPAESGLLYFDVSAKLEPAPTFMGEGFCNYLAYCVAYYRIGLKIIESFLSETKYATTSEELRGFPKKPKRNLSIKSNIKNPMLSKVMKSLADEKELSLLCKRYEEARITFAWIRNIFENQQNVDDGASEEKLMASCIDLRVNCKAQLLKFGAELLAQRIYLCNIGPMDNPIDTILAGGGINAIATKKSSWD